MNGKTALGLATFIFSIWVGWLAYLIFSVGPLFSDTKSDFSRFGQFGDSFGVLASLMAMLAVIGALYSVHAQNKNYQRQQFESNFYTLLSSVDRKKKEISVSIIGESINENLSKDHNYHKLKKLLRKKEHTYSGTDAVHLMLCRIRDSIGFDGYADTKSVARKYRKVIESNSTLKNYFRTVYHLYLMLDKSEINNKKFYSRIIRSQISDVEACLIAYNCSVDEGRFKFKRLVEVYSTFHNINSQNLDEYEQAELKFFQRKFSPSAFRFEKHIPVTYS